MRDEEPQHGPMQSALVQVTILALLVTWLQVGVIEPLGKRLERIEAQQVQILKQQGELKQAQHYLFKSAVRTEIYLANRP